MANKLAAIARAHVPAPAAPAPPGSIGIPLTTVSLNGSFDASINIYFAGAQPSSAIPMIVDSGNSMLIVPRWEDIAALPNSSSNYQVLGAVQEPWGCPANVVRGPINITTTTGDVFTVQDCVFYACTADNPHPDDPSEVRTANFGAGCLNPWSANGWNTPGNLGVTMQAPLSYATEFPFVEFNYAPAEQIHGPANAPTVAGGSLLNLYKTQPAGYQMFNIIGGIDWMSLKPQSLKIGETLTKWPGALASPIAMVDTGGGPVFLNDPNGEVFDKPWPDPAQNPDWTSSSTNCESTGDAITLQLGDANGSCTYTIDTSNWPPSVQGLTLVMCQQNFYMRGENGLNTGGISALANMILIDFANSRVGFKPK